MLRLVLDRQPRWVTLNCGVELLVAPITTAIWAMAASAPEVASLPGGAGVDVRWALQTKALARAVVRDWRGVCDEAGADLPVSPETIGALMDLATVSHEFAAAVMTPYLLLTDEKKGCAPLPTGTLAGAPDTARPATESAPTARADSTSR